MASAGPLAPRSVSLRLYAHELEPSARLDELRLQARMGVEAGFDGVMVSEHHAGFPGYVPNPVQVAGFLLESMPRGWAAPCPLLLPMKPAALVAEDVAWLARAHPGRVGAGFAAGALPVDFELAEVPFDEIVERFKVALPRVVAALRGDADGPLADDPAVAACADHPVPMVVAAQSSGAVRRAARLGLGVLYESMQGAEASARLSRQFREAGGVGPVVLIRRVWVGDPPTAAIDAQLDRYRQVAPDRVARNWAEGDGVITGADPQEAAEALAAAVVTHGADTVNVRIHFAGLEPAIVRHQLEVLADGFVDTVRARLTG